VKRYILAHWRGELSLAKSFLLNGVLGYAVLLAVLIGMSKAISSKTFDYAGMALFAAWQIWALVGILRCVLRMFREPHSVVQRILGALVFGVVALVVYEIVSDLQMLVRLAA
jgi:hypothetical protein